MEDVRRGPLGKNRGVEVLAGRPDAALLDLGLPLMDGFELAQQMVAASDGRRPVLIAVTGYGQMSDHEKSRAAGFDAHIVKPVDMPHLLKLLEQLLDVEHASATPTPPSPAGGANTATTA